MLSHLVEPFTFCAAQKTKVYSACDDGEEVQQGYVAYVVDTYSDDDHPHVAAIAEQVKQIEAIRKEPHQSSKPTARKSSGGRVQALLFGPALP
jgi:hypothetical protein